MTYLEMTETVMLMLLCAAVLSICLCRAVVMNAQAKFLPRASMAGLVMSSLGGILSPILHWATDWILLGFLASTLALMYSSRELWINGIPDVFLKWSERYPQKERRMAEDRRK